jgi:membrane protein implicated in regulation of membrane protease activity
MKHKPNDFLIGCVGIAIVVALSVFAGGLKILIYGGWAISCGLLIFLLLKVKRTGAAILAIILLPSLLLRNFMPKKLRIQLEEAKTKALDNAAPRP